MENSSIKLSDNGNNSQISQKESPKRPLTDEESYRVVEESKGTVKRPRLEEDQSIRGLGAHPALASLNALADMTHSNTPAEAQGIHPSEGNAQEALVGLHNVAHGYPYQPQYSYPPMAQMGYYPGFSPTDNPEHYQQLVLQHQYRLMEQMRAERGPEEALMGTSPPKKGRGRVSQAIPLQMYSPSYPGRFFLVEQPNVRQRKSYKNENRYLLPNPLTVCAKEDMGEKLPRILEGEVIASLMTTEGVDLSNKNILNSPEGGLRQPLDSSGAAHFSLKVLDTSENTNFRIQFHVLYTLEAIGPCEEKILSRPFQVHSNRKKNTKGPERPIVGDIKPKEGLSSQETEVWIKGKGFSDRVTVLFGDKPAKILETADNLITVMSPSRFDFLQETPVEVVISNKYANEILSAEKKFTFTYYPG